MISYVFGEVFSKIDITENSKGFNLPIWVALGKYDGLVAPLASWNKALDSFSNIKITVYDKSGHTPQYEEAELFDSDLIHWVNKHCS